MPGGHNLSIRFFACSFAVLCASLMGTTLAGGASANPTLTVLYSFTGGSDGGDPQAGLIFDKAGDLYGTTSGGGGCQTKGGCGTVFKLSPPVPPATQWTESVLYSFCAVQYCPDGGFPQAGLIFDKAGNLYGTTPLGGVQYGPGVVFKLSPPVPPATQWTETLLYSFAGGSDGGGPTAGLIADSAGNLYGTTYRYGALGIGLQGLGCGVVFKLSPPFPGATQWTETVLYTFTGALVLTTGTKDGCNPYAGVIADSAGNLYGTAQFGGGGGRGRGDLYGNGGVFKLRPDGKEGFWYPFHVTDGFHPQGGLIFDKAGNLYGTTLEGGTGGTGCGWPYCGVVFELSPGRIETVLYSFTGGNDGASPTAGLLADSAGNLYGTTEIAANGPGVVFKLSPPVPPATHWTEAVLHTFSGSDGYQPEAGLIADSAGNLYGTTLAGGAYNRGVVFKLSP